MQTTYDENWTPVEYRLTRDVVAQDGTPIIEDHWIPFAVDTPIDTLKAIFDQTRDPARHPENKNVRMILIGATDVTDEWE